MMSLACWWRRAEGADVVSLEALSGGRGIVILAPHPDDESLGCGGLLAAAAERRIPCRVVLITDGSRSHPGSATWSPARLATLRMMEMKAALKRLGHDSRSLVALDFADGFAPGDGAAAEAAAERIVAVAKGIDASAIMATWAEDPHHDHQATAAMAGLAAERMASDVRRYAYPVWTRTRPPDDMIDPRGLTPLRLPIADHLAAKRAAIACHRSQLGLVVEDDPAGFVLDPEFVERFLQPFELFIRLDHDQPLDPA